MVANKFEFRLQATEQPASTPPSPSRGANMQNPKVRISSVFRKQHSSLGTLQFPRVSNGAPCCLERERRTFQIRNLEKACYQNCLNCLLQAQTQKPHPNPKKFQDQGPRASTSIPQITFLNRSRECCLKFRRHRHRSRRWRMGGWEGGGYSCCKELMGLESVWSMKAQS